QVRVALDVLAEVDRQLTVLGEVARVDERDVRVVGDEVVRERVDDEDGRSGEERPARAYVHTRTLPPSPRAAQRAELDRVLGDALGVTRAPRPRAVGRAERGR